MRCPHVLHLLLLLLAASVQTSVIVQWRVRPDLEADWTPVDHWRYGGASSSSPADRRSFGDDFGHVVKESFLYSHHVKMIRA